MGPTSYSIAERQEAEAILLELVSEEQWWAYAPVLRTATEQGLRFAIGGGIAFSVYSGQRRNTKDLDLFLLPEQHRSFMEIMAGNGFCEYLEVPYDPTWSFRGECQGFIMDVLWGMLNDRAPMDDAWVERGLPVTVHGMELRLLPPEELIWSKVYILHRDRCDWPDILAILLARGAQLDWPHLLARLGEDAAVLGSILQLFRWLCPGGAARLPSWLWHQVGLAAQQEEDGPPVDAARLALFEGANWFPKDLQAREAGTREIGSRNADRRNESPPARGRKGNSLDC